MISKEEARKKIEELVARFAEQIDSYKEANYNETLTRRDFIDPFFKALGWDVDNSQGFAEAYREVIHEDKIKIGKATKAPDYSFRLPGGKRLFFVEAKKPGVYIKDDITVAYQIRRYGWSAKLPVSIITDFEEFAVYDCTKKPLPNHKSAVARIKYFTFRDYLAEFDYLWNTFSKESVLKGSFDRYVQSDAVKKGTASVDKDFLASLDKWRTYLATTLSLRNKNLDEDELNYVVQLVIDRLIFLRIAEDRGVEQYGQMKYLVYQKGDAYQNLFSYFKQADQKYNSGLFNFEKDTLSEKLFIDNKVVRNIVDEMYYPESPYEFSVISVEILGSAYEQFLGKQIKIDTSHHAIIEEKPEVRKAGGVYYTPQYVVEYVVKNTVGKLIDGKAPKDIENLKILDPACGSGSFLIGAYQYLLDCHRNFYLENGIKTGKKNSPLTPDGNLTSAERKRILLNNIFGVDIDVNAVEVTKLSLLLKCMEGETKTTLEQQQKLWHDRILPTLENNIKVGNSLVDSDFYDTVFDFGDEKKVKPFSWQRAFPDIFKRNVPIDKTLPYKKQFLKVKKLNDETEALINSMVSERKETYIVRNAGFDIVIGNPPYAKVTEKSLMDYFSRKYIHQDYQQDLYLLFLEQYHKLLVTGGMLGIIIPNTWLQSIKYSNIRRYLVNFYQWEKILHFDHHVFEAVVDTHVLVFEKNSQVKNTSVQIDIHHNNQIDNLQFINQNNLPDDGSVINILSTNKEKLLFEKIKGQSRFIKDVCTVFNGVKPFEKGKGDPPQTEQIVKEKPYVIENGDKPAEPHWYPLMRGRLMNRYVNHWNNNHWIKYGPWLAAPRKKEIFDADEKIIVRQTGDSIIATILNKDIIARDNMHLIISKTISLKFILGVINSKLVDFFYFQLNPEKGEVLAQVKKNHVEQLPLPVIDENNKFQHDEVIRFVEQLLALNEEKKSTILPHAIEQLESKIDFYERRINHLVYQLFHLSEDEIAIVESY